MVLVRRDGVSTPLSARYDGPYKVLRRSLRVFELQVGKRTEKVSTLRLKAANADDNAGVALPPRRGRPPNAPPATVPVIPETLKMPGGEMTPNQKTGSNPSTVVSGEKTPAQKTQVNPGKKAGQLSTNSSTPEVRLALRPCLKAEVPAKSGEKTTPTLGRGLRHHVKNRPEAVNPTLSETGRAASEIDRRSGTAKKVSFSLRNGWYDITYIPEGFLRPSPANTVPQAEPPSDLGRPVRSRRPP